MTASYPQTLAAAWRAHLAPRDPAAPTAVSLFAGCGGSTLGCSMAGYRELLAVEWDDHAVNVFRLNFPHVPLYHGDIRHLAATALPLEPGQLDLLDGSPPCQGISASGLRQLDDPRNQLFREFTRLLAEWRPKVFMMENVAGLVHPKMRPLSAEIMHGLRASEPGYHVRARLVEASYLGVPQRRQRMIIVGVRTDLRREAVHPVPFTRPVTVRDAIGDLARSPGLLEDIGPRIKPLAALIPRGGTAEQALRARGGREMGFNLKRLRWDTPSNTIPKMFSNTLTVGLLHPDENRYLGVAELARVQSFPDEWQWGDSTYTAAHARIGNSVPPLMMRAIAATIREQILTPAPG